MWLVAIYNEVNHNIWKEMHTMKFEILYIIQLIFLFSIITYTYMCFRFYIYKNKKKFKESLSIDLNNINLDFSKNLTSEKYKTYEKIDIWRYCTLF